MVRPGRDCSVSPLHSTPFGLKRFAASSTEFASSRPPTRHCSASVLSRAPLHVVHGVYARYRDKSTRTCILYDLVSSHSKKRLQPYQTSLLHGPSPSMTHLR